MHRQRLCQMADEIRSPFMIWFPHLLKDGASDMKRKGVVRVENGASLIVIAVDGRIQA
jgi:hypothetical protein